MSDRTRNSMIVAVVVVALGLIVWLSSSAARSTNDLSDILRRRSPVTDYQAAEFGHNDCRKNYEDAYLGAIGDLITLQRSDPLLQPVIAEIARLKEVLRNIEQHCPTPKPPVFDDDGTMVTPPVIPTTTTSTTVPLPTTPATAPGGR